MNKFHKRSKSSVLAIINGPVVISYSSDKAKPFVMKFTSNSTLDDNDHPLPDFPSLTGHKRSDFSILACEVSRFFQSLDAMKTTGVDKIPVIDLKNLRPELSPVSSKLFNRDNIFSKVA